MEIDRFQAVMDRAGQRFLARVFTPAERRLCQGKSWRLAGRFAAKEALFKAAGTGMRGFTWQQIEVLADDLGAPRVVCTGRFAAVLRERGVDRIHLSISHAKEYAAAQAVLEGEAAP